MKHKIVNRPPLTIYCVFFWGGDYYRITLNSPNPQNVFRRQVIRTTVGPFGTIICPSISSCSVPRTDVRVKYADGKKKKGKVYNMNISLEEIVEMQIVGLRAAGFSQNFNPTHNTSPLCGCKKVVTPRSPEHQVCVFLGTIYIPVTDWEKKCQ